MTESMHQDTETTSSVIAPSNTYGSCSAHLIPARNFPSSAQLLDANSTAHNFQLHQFFCVIPFEPPSIYPGPTFYHFI